MADFNPTQKENSARRDLPTTKPRKWKVDPKKGRIRKKNKKKFLLIRKKEGGKHWGNTGGAESHKHKKELT